MITSIQEFKRQIFENTKNIYVGIHCSQKSLDNDDFYGKIIDEYCITFKQVLELIQLDYPGAKELLQKIESCGDELSLVNDTVDLVFEIVDFFADNNLEWIFVSNGEAMTKYGDNCYRVFFKDMNHVYSMQDELTDNATIYIYNSTLNKPILTV